MQIKEAYRKLCLKHHPDLVDTASRPAAEQYVKTLNSAYNALIKRGGTIDHSFGPSTSYSAAQAAWKSGGGAAAAATRHSPRFGNGLVAGIISMPLLLLGFYLQSKAGAAPSGEWTVRPYGLLHPPVNPFLREDLKPRVYSRLSSPGDGS